MQARDIYAHRLWRLLCAGIVGSRCSEIVSRHRVFRSSSPCLLSGLPAFLPSVGCRSGVSGDAGIRIETVGFPHSEVPVL
jgi:hypothetical protein